MTSTWTQYRKIAVSKDISCTSSPTQSLSALLIALLLEEIDEFYMKSMLVAGSQPVKPSFPCTSPHFLYWILGTHPRLHKILLGIYKIQHCIVLVLIDLAVVVHFYSRMNEVNYSRPLGSILVLQYSSCSTIAFFSKFNLPLTFGPCEIDICVYACIMEL